MKHLYKYTLSFLFTMLWASAAHAQFSLYDSYQGVGDYSYPGLNYKRYTNIQVDMRNPAYWRAEKIKRRNRINYLEYRGSLVGTGSQFFNWASGGTDAINATALSYIRHVRNMEKFSMDHFLDLRYGFQIIDGTGMRKTDDLINYNNRISWKMHRNWSYSGTLDFKTQFDKGYAGDGVTKVSQFMAPGYLTASLGFTYKKDKKPWIVTINPISGKGTFVMDKELSDKGAFGVEAGKNFKAQFGSLLDIYFDKSFGKSVGKNNKFRYYSHLNVFYNYEADPVVWWDNAFTFKLTNLITAAAYWQFKYDVNAKTPQEDKVLQYTHKIELGISYTFKNKEKP